GFHQLLVVAFHVLRRLGNECVVRVERLLGLQLRSCYRFRRLASGLDEFVRLLQSLSPASLCSLRDCDEWHHQKTTQYERSSQREWSTAGNQFKHVLLHLGESPRCRFLKAVRSRIHGCNNGRGTRHLRRQITVASGSLRLILGHITFRPFNERYSRSSTPLP